MQVEKPLSRCSIFQTCLFLVSGFSLRKTPKFVYSHLLARNTPRFVVCLVQLE